ncbi:Trans-1,2-dihydrobenzene-1,2-diol dehydrogenase [Fusarium oxysporum f. sp. raphani]|uniref:D-xylose 1-dehydrogenase (NADP(+), D-xylono-1,5-lactone-forming) n=1 Tax=Fusarium oxysporum f. sp. raphani TaxID=96318 RepID=A0A8J5PXV3_FUSOX|nr:Trans-1,2-dihydrobenzene-1,2-diol dehydrogenase [Fusarium oxysporum f. sp. raphani]
MTSSADPLPHLRWGILGTGWVSSMFLRDLLTTRPDAKATHTITAIGSSSIEKGTSFVEKLWEKAPDKPKPQVYADYQGVYDDPNVDIVYIGTPHSLHRKNCLDAIAAGKHILCEKPFTINAKEAKDIVDAARKKGVFVMEAAWVRFCSLFEALHEEIIVKKSIGEVQRLSIDFGNKFDLSSLPDNHRLKDPALGGGALLDIGFYTLTFASIILGDWKVGKDHPKPTKVLSSLDIVDGIDAANTVVLEYPSANGGVKTGVCTSSFRVPGGFRVTEGERPGPPAADTRTTRVFNVERHEGTLGFYWEADAVAQDIAKGKTESDVVPLDETLRLMELMDEIRAANGLKYPQDEN